MDPSNSRLAEVEAVTGHLQVRQVHSSMFLSASVVSQNQLSITTVQRLIHYILHSNLIPYAFNAYMTLPNWATITDIILMLLIILYAVLDLSILL